MSVAQSSKLVQVDVMRARSYTRKSPQSSIGRATGRTSYIREVLLCYVLNLHQNESGKGAHAVNASCCRQERQLKGDHHSGAAEDIDALAQAPTSGLGIYRPHIPGSGGQKEQ